MGIDFRLRASQQLASKHVNMDAHVGLKPRQNDVGSARDKVAEFLIVESGMTWRQGGNLSGELIVLVKDRGTGRGGIRHPQRTYGARGPPRYVQHGVDVLNGCKPVVGQIHISLMVLEMDDDYPRGRISEYKILHGTGEWLDGRW